MMIKVSCFIFTITLFFCSCRFTAPLVQYTPGLVHVPTTNVKGELDANIIYSTGRDPVNDLNDEASISNYKQEVNGVQIQTAYAIQDNIALQGSFLYSGENNSSFTDSISTAYQYKRSFLELGITLRQKGALTNKWVTAVSFGGGYGKNKTTETSNRLSLPAPYYNHNLFTVFFQPSVYKKSKNIYFVFGTKFSYCNFNRVETTYTNLVKTQKGLFTERSSGNFLVDFYAQFAYYIPNFPGIGFNVHWMSSADLTRKMFNNLNSFNFGIGCCFKLFPKSK